MNNIRLYYTLILISFSILLHAQKNENIVRIHELSDPQGLNPYTSSDAVSAYIESSIFCRLLEYDNETMELIPQTAIARPEIEEITEGEYTGGMSLTYEIHPKAKWDNGKPITAHDYIFTMKMIKNPKVYAAPYQSYYEFVEDITIDEKNSKRFTIWCKEIYFLAEATTGDLFILPEYIYDEKQLMRNFTIPELNKAAKDLYDKPKLQEFADQFNSKKFSHETIIGGGPYKFVEWEEDKKIVLERKKKWWGDKVKDRPNLVAYPDGLEFLIISDFDSAISVAENGNIDIIRSIPATTFIDKKEDRSFAGQFDFYTPPQFAYYYIAFNMDHPCIQDKEVRQALGHLMNRDEIVEILYYGFAETTNSPINPYRSYYNHDLEDVSHDREKARELLTEAGWEDTNGDGILDKEIGGERVEMRLSYKYNQGNHIRRNIGLMLKDEAARVGIDIEVVSSEWTVFFGEIKERDFELYCGAWVQGPQLDDMRQIWHTNAITREGSNRTGFGNAESDVIVDEIAHTLDNEKRTELYMEIQEIIHEEQPYIFLFVPYNRIIISNRFEYDEPSALRPGYNVHSFRLKN